MNRSFECSICYESVYYPSLILINLFSMRRNSVCSNSSQNFLNNLNLSSHCRLPANACLLKMIRQQNCLLLCLYCHQLELYCLSLNYFQTWSSSYLLFYSCWKVSTESLQCLLIVWNHMDNFVSSFCTPIRIICYSYLLLQVYHSRCFFAFFGREALVVGFVDQQCLVLNAMVCD